MEDSDYPPEIPGRSFLTKSQREFLYHGGNGFNSHQQRNLRYQIRHNIQSTLMDFQLLNDLDEKDHYKAMAPLSVYYGADDIADWVLENESEDLQDLHKVEIPDNDEEEEKYRQLGKEMHWGLAHLLTLYITWYGPERFGQLVQLALNTAVMNQSVMRGEDAGAFDVTFHHIDSVSDAWAEQTE